MTRPLPEINLDAPPPDGGQVSPGDEMEFDAIAQESRDGPTWQTGVKSFRLVANSGGLIGDEQTSDSGSAQPCADEQWDLRSLATYTVPADAPPLIEICGIAADFSENERSTCIDLYTGEVWDGTVESVVTADGPAGPCGNPIAIDRTARFVVAGDGTVTGTYDITGCGVTEPHAEFTGTATDTQFLIPDLIVFTNGEPIPKLSPTHAAGHVHQPTGSSCDLGDDVGDGLFVVPIGRARRDALALPNTTRPTAWLAEREG